MGMGKNLRPRQATLRLAQAMRQGYDVRKLLDIQGKLLSLENRRHSLPATVAAMRSWHGHAVSVLGYAEDGSWTHQDASSKSKSSHKNKVTALQNLRSSGQRRVARAVSFGMGILAAKAIQMHWARVGHSKRWVLPVSRQVGTQRWG